MNTTTLNMTTLDGGVIIKKGTAPAPPSGGGEDLDSLIYCKGPNRGSELGFIDYMQMSIASKYQRFDTWSSDTLLGILITEGYQNSFLAGDVQYDMSAIAYSEDLKMVLQYGELKFNSLKEFLEFQGASFEEFVDSMIEAYGLTRITKEEFWDLETPIKTE